jgi:hypothetical protein
MNPKSMLARVARVAFTSLAAVAAAVLLGCAANTRMNGVWVDPAAGSRVPASNVHVIGIDQDSTARRIYEDAIVAQLAARGIKSQPSYNLLPELGPTPPNVYTVPKVEVETRLYAVKDPALRCSGSSTTNPTSSMEKAINEFATVLVQEFVEEEVIA